VTIEFTSPPTFNRVWAIQSHPAAVLQVLGKKDPFNRHRSVPRRSRAAQRRLNESLLDPRLKDTMRAARC
jgi:hypothetical protein